MIAAIEGEAPARGWHTIRRSVYDGRIIGRGHMPHPAGKPTLQRDCRWNTPVPAGAGIRRSVCLQSARPCNVQWRDAPRRHTFGRHRRELTFRGEEELPRNGGYLCALSRSGVIQLMTRCSEYG